MRQLNEGEDRASHTWPTVKRRWVAQGIYDHCGSLSQEYSSTYAARVSRDPAKRNLVIVDLRGRRISAGDLDSDGCSFRGQPPRDAPALRASSVSVECCVPAQLSLMVGSVPVVRTKE
ncbi:unnamed protein product [Tuber aestivum]|uniref:Uncharacterized protein n=1 Tax=Tuber aestivum TaxID=59557 RepID=A0A292PVX0_9PEZI|nr:unnamed protein product [Tuber aestivum]